MLQEYTNSLPDVEDISFPVPSKEDIEAVERYANALRKRSE
jgi:hypothetical protein